MMSTSRRGLTVIAFACVAALLVISGDLHGRLWSHGDDGIVLATPFLHRSSRFPVSLNVKREDLSLPVEKIFAAIVPHHLWASPVITETLSAIAARRSSDDPIRRVVLLAPNHFLRGEHGVLTSDGAWETTFGRVNPDTGFISELVRRNLAAVDRDVLEGEHGMFGVIPFVAHFFPGASVVPLILMEPVDDTQIMELARFLSERVGEEGVVIVSADFSHYLPEYAADFHDAMSVAALERGDPSFARRMDVDTWPSIAVLLEFLKLNGGQRFHLVQAANAVDFAAGATSEETTSYVGGYFTVGFPAAEARTTILAFGDLMLDRHVATLTKRSGDFSYPFERIDLLLRGVAVRIANLEGPITDAKSIAEKTLGLRFTFSPLFLSDLQKRFEAFNLANNHVLDFGGVGLAQTRTLLTGYGIQPFGDPQNAPGHESTLIEDNGVRIGLVGYSAFAAGGTAPVEAEIERLRARADFVLVMAHWGNEYESEPSAAQHAAASSFVRAGADAVVGSHPHVIQPIEFIEGRPVFYSLGNFIFDQYFSDAVMRGLAVGIILEKRYDGLRTTYYLFPLALGAESRPSLAGRELREAMLGDLARRSQIPDSVRVAVLQGIIYGTETD